MKYKIYISRTIIAEFREKRMRDIALKTLNHVAGNGEYFTTEPKSILEP